MRCEVPGIVLILLLCVLPTTTGKIGPPALGIRKMENQIIIDLFHPLTAISGRQAVPIYDENNCHTFMYIVYMKINGSEVCVSVDLFFCC